MLKGIYSLETQWNSMSIAFDFNHIIKQYLLRYKIEIL